MYDLIFFLRNFFSESAVQKIQGVRLFVATLRKSSADTANP